ncbi:ParB/RepB/Spo0J family partition protein [Emticicia sp. BO119]|uniref:ParB/RepB/Spo0J family partition protein n=1 Tax=Emticicia sp. BO119 TaxID=2757768 RepID=UPI0015F0CE5A|nr:ParB/RepB/Spo0J family partition protein [Emticicia sp. BO119]MBA4849911.1 ParB/RepB/Spo0J family partition protein [Emticicia sp. BO119]
MESKIVNTKKSMTGLGRGLGALLSDSGNTSTETPAIPRRLEAISSMHEVLIESVETNPYQPRTHFDQEALQELAESIKVLGIIQPITVKESSPGRYTLISGERRLQASKLAGLTKIPAYIRTADDQQMLEMALIENIQRENLNAIEIALSYHRLLSEFQLKQEELGDRVGKNRTTVNNYLRLLKLPDVIQAAVRDNEISMGHARALINIDNHETQIKLFSKVVEENWSVRKIEDEVRRLALLIQEDTKGKRQTSIKQEISSLQFRLQGYFGTKVLVKADEKHKGEIKIPFSSKDELDRILNSIKVNQE